ncbi:hypothetical protein DIPPA_35010 [Diplonema papillatum]|nr:hypothetical protein DIPPA_35010 [Diplonema papillatum]
MFELSGCLHALAGVAVAFIFGTMDTPHLMFLASCSLLSVECMILSSWPSLRAGERRAAAPARSAARTVAVPLLFVPLTQCAVDGGLVAGDSDIAAAGIASWALAVALLSFGACHADRPDARRDSLGVPPEPHHTQVLKLFAFLYAAGLAAFFLRKAPAAAGCLLVASTLSLFSILGQKKHPEGGFVNPVPKPPSQSEYLFEALTTASVAFVWRAAHM